MPGTIEMWPWKAPPRITQTTRDKSGVSTTMSKEHSILGILLVSKQTRQEALSIYFGSNKFKATDTNILAQFYTVSVQMLAMPFEKSRSGIGRESTHAKLSSFLLSVAAFARSIS